MYTICCKWLATSFTLNGCTYIGLFKNDEATIVCNDNHLVAVNGDFDRVFEAVGHKVHHDVSLAACLKDLRGLIPNLLTKGFPAHFIVGTSCRTILVRESRWLYAPFTIKGLTIQVLKIGLTAVYTTLAYSRNISLVHTWTCV